ncbi:MAG: DUF3500 domain-containing protein [Acidobacteriota bacterium]|nr:DUF3500 domain-containing protein [Acidobacteriota bacterium]
MSTRDAEIDALVGSGAGGLAELMGEAATNLLASLAGDERSDALFTFGDEERQRWFFTPNRRPGLPLRRMDHDTRQLTLKLLALGLSRSGYVAASTIMGLETTLDLFERFRTHAGHRDSDRYYLSLFGEPHPTEPWGWQVEGHHLSVNYTLAEGRILSPTPCFFGSNPADAPLGKIGVLRPLGGSEDLARELVRSLEDEERESAILSHAAPSDIVTANRSQISDGHLPIDGFRMMGMKETDDLLSRAARVREKLGHDHHHDEAVRYTAVPKGIASDDLAPSRREILTALVDEYLDRLPDVVAEAERAHLGDLGVGLHFAWAGGLEKGDPHYYRLQADRFLIEYDNTQNDANHIHSVWRHPGNDFAADILARHYQHAHDPTHPHSHSHGRHSH